MNKKNKMKTLSTLLMTTPLMVLPITVSCNGEKIEEPQTIKNVVIEGYKQSYVQGQQINLIAKVIMSNGHEANIDNVSYKWLLDDQSVSNLNTFSEVASIAKHNGKIIKLEVEYNNQTALSDPLTLIVKPSEAQKQNLNDEINRLKTIKVTPKNAEISQADFDAITVANILEKINIELKTNDFDYQFVELNKNLNQVTFKIKVSIKGVDDFQLVDKQFSVTFTTPSIKSITIKGNSSVVEGTKFDLTAEVEMSGNFEVPAGAKYEWMLDGTPVAGATTNKFDPISSIANYNGKKLTVKIIAEGMAPAVSNEVTLVVEKSPLSLEIERIKACDEAISIPNEITKDQFNQINAQNIIDIVATQLSLNKEKFDYQATSFNSLAEQNQVTFSLEVGIKGTGEFQPITKTFIVTFKLAPTIKRVEIVGSNTVIEGQNFNLTANIIMSNNSQAPTEGISYKWILQGQNNPVSTTNTFSEVANITTHNNKVIKLEVTYNGQTISSNLITLVVNKSALTLEIERIQNLNEIIAPKNSNISQTDFDIISSSNIIEKINIDLNFNEFDYEITDLSKTSNQINFKVMVSYKNANDYKLVDKLFNVTFNVIANIKNVEIIGGDKAFSAGDQVNLIAKVIMSDNSQAPTEGISYKWILQGQIEPISSSEKCSFIADYAKHNGKTITLEVTYNGQTISSNPLALIVNKSALTLEIERINNLTISLKNPAEITKIEYDNINEKNILDQINIDLKTNEFDYQVIAFKKSIDQVSFKLNVKVKNTENYLEATKTFEVKFNVQTYIANLTFTGLKSPAIYSVGETINLTVDNVIMSKGEVPSVGIVYEWYLTNKTNGTLAHKIGNGSKLSYEIKPEDVGECEIKVKAIYNGIHKYSDNSGNITINKSALMLEIERLQGLNATPNTSEISQVDFDAITESNILNHINIDLKYVEFDYQFVELSKSSNQISFKIKVRAKGNGEFQLVNKPFIVIFNIEPTIKSVSFTGLNSSYVDGNVINLISNVTMLNNNAQIPNELIYEWWIGNERVSTQKDCSIVAKANYNGERIKLKVLYRKQIVESLESILIINPEMPPKILVSITGLRPWYVDGDEINLKANIVMSDGSKPPAKFVYNWYHVNKDNDGGFPDGLNKGNTYTETACFPNSGRRIRLNIQLVDNTQPKPQLLNYDSPTLTFEIYRRLVKAQIKNLEYSYNEGEKVKLISDVAMSDGWKLPEDLKYEWIINNQLVSTDPNYSFVANLADDDKKIKLRVSYKGNQVIETEERKLWIKKTSENPIVVTSILGLKPYYVDGETINLSSKLAMSNGTVVPNDLVCEWLLNDKVVSSGNEYSFKALATDNNKKIKLRVKYNTNYYETYSILTINRRLASVSINGLKDWYYNEEIINFSPNIKMANIAGDSSDIFYYEWYINNQLVSNNENFRFDASLYNNGMRVKLKVSYKGQVVESNESIIIIKQEKAPYILVSISGLKDSYLVGESISLNADLKMSDGSKVPNDNELRFQWVIDGNYVYGANDKNYAFTATANLNGKKIKLLVINKSQAKIYKSKELIISVIQRNLYLTTKNITINNNDNRRKKLLK